MKIIQKFYLIFSLIFLLILSGGYLSIKTSERILEKSIEEHSLLFASEVHEKIDRNIQRRIEIFQEYSHDLILREGIIQSNKEFEKLENIREYIDEKDREWTFAAKETITPFMRTMMNNRLAGELSEKYTYYNKKYAYPIFGEIIVTNKFGANVAITGKTTDYRQDDEEWWQVAKRDDVYVKDVEFDDSAGVYSIDIGIGIKDGEGNFIGVFKIIYNIQDVINELKNMSKSELFKKHKSAKYTLVTRDVNVIFSTENYKLLQGLTLVEPHSHVTDELSLVEKRKLSHGNRLMIHSHSKGYKDFKSLGWISIVEFDTDEIYLPIEQLKKSAGLITVLVALLAAIIGIFISRNIRKPIVKLSNAVKKIGAGKRDVQLELKTNDEIGELAESFKKMMENLVTTTASRDELLEEIKRREKTERELRESRASLAEAQRVAHLGFWDWDIKRNILHWSDETYRIFGITKETFEATHEAFMNSVHPNDQELVTKSVDAALYKRSPYDIEHRIVLPDGQKRVVHGKAMVTYSEEGLPIRMLGTVLNITEQKLAEQKLRLTQFAIDRAVSCAFWMGPDAKFIYVNNVACKKLGYTREELLSMSVHDIGPDFPAERWPEHWVDLKENTTLTFESRHQRKDGTVFPVEIMANFLEFEGKEYNCAFARDITERKIAEEKLKDFAEELEWKNLTLEQAKDEAEKATELKDKFVSLVVHDLKSPLTSITGFLQLIRDEADPSNTEQKAMFDIILDSSNKMIETIDGLLDLSRLKAGHIIPNKEFIEARSLVKAVINRLAHLASEKGIELINDIPQETRLNADYELFFGVIQNLLSNAIKFCKRGDQITIFLPLDSKSAVAVKDTGVGIQEELLPDLFKHHVKTSTHGTAAEKGTGMGLPFAHEIMKAHGGILTVQSEAGKGSVFCAELPYVRPRILIVEDDKETRALFKIKLKKIDVITIEAENGKEALAAMEENDFDLILADIQMPAMGGFEMLEHIRKNPKTEIIPVILVTGKDLKSREKAFRLGANDFITKPLDSEKFIKKIRNVVR